MSGRASAVASGIDPLVARVRLEAGEHEIAHEAVLAVDHVRARGARGQGPLRDALPQRAATDVHGERHHLHAVLLPEPRDGDRRVQSAGVGEDDLLHE